MINRYVKSFILLLLCVCGGLLGAGPREEGQAEGSFLHQKGYNDPSPDLQNIEQELKKQPENAGFEAQNQSLSRSFERNYDGGRKGEDPLKAHLSEKTVEQATKPNAHQPSLKESQKFASQKHRFKIADTDPVLDKDTVITKVLAEHPLDPEGKILQKPTPTKHPPKPKTFKCRQSAPQSATACTKRLVLRAIPQEPLIKTVTAHFKVRCFNLVHYSINLKTGLITNSDCENRGPVNMYVDHPLGDDPHLSQATVKLLSHQHYGEGGVEFRNGGMTPNAANGFTASFTAFQPKTGKKHRDNRNLERGGRYTWEFTIPQDPLLEEHWEGCESLEIQEQSGTCYIRQFEHQALEERRMIEGYPAPVVRDHWTEQRSYVCGEGEGINECQTLIDQGCEQIDSRCAVLKNGVCLEYKNTFRCGVPHYAKGSGLVLDRGKLGFAKIQKESQSGYEAADFAEGFSHFHAMTEMAKPMEDGLGGISQDENNPQIFRGHCKQCRVTCLSSIFRDCCKLKGLLQNFLGGCNDGEKELAIAAVKQSRCVRVGGRYCSNRKRIGPVKVCIEKRDSYCCYGSKLARIIQEIAHQQLGISFGTEEQPHCGPLTAEQLSRIDFDTPYARAKLSEILGEVQASAQQKFEGVQEAVAKIGPIHNKMKGLEENLAKQAQHLKRLHQNKIPLPVPQEKP